MANSKGIENLPQDALTEIMTRVGQQPGGAADIARAVSVSKTLREFVNDGDVLRSISFEDSSPCFVGQYELLSEIDGLVMRCSKAGNLSAQFILSKVVLANSSKLCRAKIEAPDSDADADADASLSQHSTLSTQNCNLTDLYKATRLLDHLSVENTDLTELLDLVRTFLSKANVEDIFEMQRHLENFIGLFLVHGKKHLLQQFHNTLDYLCEKCSFPIVTASVPLDFVIEKLNRACHMGHNIMGDVVIDEVVYSPLLECLIEKDDDVAYEMLLERVDIVETILNIGGDIASAQNDHNALLVIRCILRITATLRRYLRLIDHTAFIQSTRRKLLKIFNTLFDV